MVTPNHAICGLSDTPGRRRLTPRAAGRLGAGLASSAGFLGLALLLGVGIIGPKLLQHASGNTADLDTGNYSNFAWGILHGQGFYGSVLGRHHLGEHFSPIMVLIAPLYLVRPTAYILMMIQGLAVAAGLVLVLHFASQRLREVARLALKTGGTGVASWSAGHLSPAARSDAGVLEYSSARDPIEPGMAARLLVPALLLGVMMLSPPLLATWNTQFQPIELGFPLVIAAIMLMEHMAGRRVGVTQAVGPAPRSSSMHILLGLVVILLLMTRESAPLSVLGLAIYAAGALRRWRLALVLAAVALVWLWLAMGVIMPYFRDGARWGHTRWLGWSQMWDLKAFYLAALVGGLGFLPLLGRGALWATAGAVPGVMLNLAVARKPQIAFEAHYDAQISAFLVIAAAHGAVTLAAWLLLRRSGARPILRRTGFAFCAVLCLAAGWGFLSQTEMRTVPQRWHDWWPTPVQRKMINQAKTQARLHADAPVLCGHARVGPHVGHRLNYRSIRAKTPRQWREWAAQRLEPGTILIIPGARYMKDDGVRGVLLASGHAELIHESPYVQVFRWPEDAPPAGTRQAELYVREGMVLAAEAAAQVRVE